MRLPPRLIIVVAAVALAVAANLLGVDMDAIQGFLGLLNEDAAQ